MLKSKSSGFTLIEVMVVVAIAAILATLAIPSFTAFINSTRQTALVSELVADLNFARNEAVKRNARTLVCARNAAGTACSNGTNWSVGWLVCADEDSDGTCDASTTTNPNPSKVHAPVNGVLTLTSGNSAAIRFNANGSQVQGTSTIATLTLTGSGPGLTTRTLNIAPSGNISK
jgi:type IV fimbrial biogenesis protein FimT